jgi:hypothetical protein
MTNYRRNFIPGAGHFFTVNQFITWIISRTRG